MHAPARLPAGGRPRVRSRPHLQVSGPPGEAPLNMSSPAVASTPDTIANGSAPPSLVLQPNALRPRSAYVFQLAATDVRGYGAAQLVVPVSGAPRGVAGAAQGGLRVTPASGTALTTAFALAALGWDESDDGPLSYQARGFARGVLARGVSRAGFRARGFARGVSPAGFLAGRGAARARAG